MAQTLNRVGETFVFVCCVALITMANADASSTGATTTLSPTNTTGATTTPSPTNTTGATTTPSPTNTTGATTTPSPTNTTGATTTPSPTNTTGATTTPSPTNTTGATTTPSPTNTTGATTTPSPTNTTGATTTPSPTNTTGATTTPSPTNTTGATTTPSPTNTTGATTTPSPTSATGTTTTPSPTSATGTTTTPSPTNTTGTTTTPGDTGTTTTPGDTGTTTTPGDTGTTTPTSVKPLTSQPSSTPIPGKSVFHMDQLSMKVSFTVKFKEPFDEKLYDKDSDIFNQTATLYKSELTKIFRETTGFKAVTIIRFWNGSIGVDYKVEYQYNKSADAKTFQADLDKAGKALKKVEAVDADYLTKIFPYEVASAARMLAQVQKDPCRIENVCRDQFSKCHLPSNGEQIICINQCADYDCGSHGQCVLNSTGQPWCRCPVDEKYVYGGTRCEQKAEKLDLSSNTIIVIAAGVGGGLVFILSLSLAITCFCRRRRHGAKKQTTDEDQQSDVSFQSMTGMNGVNGMIMGVSPSSKIRHHHPSSGLPAERMEEQELQSSGVQPLGEPTSSHPGQLQYGEDGRMYRVMKEADVFQPELQGVHAFRNEAYVHHPEQMSRTDRRVSQAGISRYSQETGQRDNVYTAIDDNTYMYQPYDHPQQPRYTNVGHLNPVAKTDPAQLSGFPRHDDVRRPEETTRFGDERSSRLGSMTRYSDSRNSAYVVHPVRETAYPERESAFTSSGDFDTRDNREFVYGGRETEETTYAQVSTKRALRPEHRVEDGLNPLIHDYTELGGGGSRPTSGYEIYPPRGNANGSSSRHQHQHQHHRAGGAKEPPAHIFDYIPEEKVHIKRPFLFGKPAY